MTGPIEPTAADREPTEAAADPAQDDAAEAVPDFGHPRVDEALEALAQTRGLTPAEQIAGYEAVHRTLQETLATIDEGQS